MEGDSEEQGDSSHVIICSATGVGCSGRLRLLLTWRAQSQLHPDIEADLNLDPLQVMPFGFLWMLPQSTHTFPDKAPKLGSGRPGSNGCLLLLLVRRMLLCFCCTLRPHNGQLLAAERRTNIADEHLRIFTSVTVCFARY